MHRVSIRKMDMTGISGQWLSTGTVLFILLVLASTWVPTSSEYGNPTYEDQRRLIDHLFNDSRYNPNIRPIRNLSDSVIIYVDYVLYSIVSFIESTETLATSGYLSLTWMDELLSWNESDYNGLTYIHVSQNQIWKPDIELQNSVSDLQRNMHENLFLWLHSDGFIIWEPVQILYSTCEVNVQYFPFDAQTCDLKFVAWSYTKDYVYLEVDKNFSFSLERYTESPSWEIVHLKADETFHSVDSLVIFTMTLKRKSLFYIINIIIPNILLSLLTTFVYMLPTTSGERASYSITVFLSFAVFLTLITEKFPSSSNATPYLSIYICVMLIMSMASVLISLIQQRLLTQGTNSDPPPSLCRKLFYSMQALRCQQRHKFRRSCSDIDDENDAMGSDEHDKIDVTWEDAVAAIDFYCFWISLIILVTSAVVVGYLGFNNK